VPNQALKIAKAMRQVKMWIHPEGLVNGSIFVATGADATPEEDPAHVLNNDTPFLVMRTGKNNDVRFYNRNSIIRVEYESSRPSDSNMTRAICQVTMMDGSIIDGEVIEDLPEQYARLYDYLNHTRERFIRLFTTGSEVCMLNKSYVVKVTTS